MSIKSRIAKLEKTRQAAFTALPLVRWENFYVSKPEDIMPDRSELDWMDLRFGPPMEVTDVVDKYVAGLDDYFAELGQHPETITGESSCNADH